MNTLTGKQRKYLRGQAHHLDPVVHVGGKGLTDTVLAEADRALARHELIKIKFLDFKDAKEELTQKICAKLGCLEVGLIGHHAILFRQAEDPDDRTYRLPG